MKGDLSGQKDMFQEMICRLGVGAKMSALEIMKVLKFFGIVERISEEALTKTVYDSYREGNKS